MSRYQGICRRCGGENVVPRYGYHADVVCLACRLEESQEAEAGEEEEES
jgi:hypothetical protein